MALEIGLMIEGQEGVTWPEWLALAAAAEEHGFSGLYRSDHYLSERIGSGRDALDAWGTICALAAVTSRIRLGTIVSPATFRHPSVLAKLAVTADHVSSGRVEVGMGTGWFEEEHAAYGFAFDAPGARMDVLEEQIEIVKGSWGAEPFTFEGAHYRLVGLDAQPKPLQWPGPRLILGGYGGPRSAALAARWADEYNTPEPTHDQLRARRAALSSACEEVGRDPASLGLSVVTGVVVGRDRRELEARALRVVRFLGEEAQDGAAALESLPETWLVGRVEEVAGALRSLEALGVSRAMLWAPLHDDLEMVALVGREVVPLVS